MKVSLVLWVVLRSSQSFLLGVPAPRVGPLLETVRLEDRDVPEEHRGLHDMLYGSGSAHEAISAESQRGAVEDGTVSYDARRWAHDCGPRKVTGVYTVRDRSGRVAYVGVSRDVASALRSHAKRNADAVATVRVVEKTSMARREDLEAMRARVLAALDEIPPGNANPELWAESAAEATPDDDQKRRTYDDSKRKLQAAMALVVPDEPTGALRQATESDDWSAVVGAQHGDTIVSPFASSTAVVADKAAIRPFDRDQVDRVLDSIRPMLLADGGNVGVVSADPRDKSVVLRLEGACGSCPSSTVTMKNGIEQALRAAWPDLGPVTRLEDQTRLLTAEAADRLLDPIRNAIHKLGARATVLSASLLGPGVVELDYEGPDTVRYGIELSLLDSPLVTEVRWYTDLNAQEEVNAGSETSSQPK